MPPGLAPSNGTWQYWAGGTVSNTSTDNVWRYWVDTGTASATVTNTVWSCWNDNTSTSGAVGSDSWYCWNYTLQVGVPPITGVQFPRPGVETVSVGSPPLTPAEIEASRRADEEQRLQREEENRQREKAEAVATELLISLLSEKQRQQLAEKDWFLVESQSGKRYRIRRGWSANVDVLDEEGRVVRRLCIHPRDYRIPVADSMAAQKLLLEADEQTLLQTANPHSGTGEVVDLRAA